LEANKRAETNTVEEIRGQLFQLASMLDMIQQEHQPRIASFAVAQEAPETGASMVNGIPVEDAVT
jgi:hypothetical protein